MLPLASFSAEARLSSHAWSIILTIIFAFTRIFEGYDLSLINMLQHINAGDAEPLAIFFLLSSVLIFLKFTKTEIRINSKFYNFLFGFLLFLSVSIRPYYLPTAFIFILALFVTKIILIFNIYGFNVSCHGF